MQGNVSSHDIKNKLCLHLCDLKYGAKDIEIRSIENAYHYGVKHYVEIKHMPIIEAQIKVYKLLGGKYEI